MAMGFRSYSSYDAQHHIVETALPSVVSTDTQKVGKIPSEGTKEEESKIKPLILTMDEAHLHFGCIRKERLLRLV